MNRQIILPFVSTIAFFMPVSSAISTSSITEEDILHFLERRGDNSGAFDEVQIPGYGI